MTTMCCGKVGEGQGRACQAIVEKARKICRWERQWSGTLDAMVWWTHSVARLEGDGRVLEGDSRTGAQKWRLSAGGDGQRKHARLADGEGRISDHGKVGGSEEGLSGGEVRPKGSGSGRKGKGRGKGRGSLKKPQGGGKGKRPWFWYLVKDCGRNPIQKVGQQLVKVHKLDPKTVALLLKKKVHASNWAVRQNMPNPSIIRNTATLRSTISNRGCPV